MKLKSSLILPAAMILAGVLFTTSFAHANTLRKVCKLSSAAEAKAILSAEDAYTNVWSKFDIGSKPQNATGTKKDLLKYIGEQTRDWMLQEMIRMDSVIVEVDSQLAALGIVLPLPDTIRIMKTTCNEEGGANGYTRMSNIVLSSKLSGMSRTELKRLFIHELFHVLSRNNPELRKKCYAIIGATIQSPVVLPTVLADRVISNPDAPYMDCYLTLKHNGNDVHCMMLLYSDKDYVSGSFFQYMHVGFLKLDTENPEKVDMSTGSPILYGMNDLTGFYEQVGKNTKYIIHPEEIMADNFVLAVNNNTQVANPEIVTAVQNFLRDK